MWYGVVNEDINKDMVCSKSLKSCCVGDVRTCAHYEKIFGHALVYNRRKLFEHFVKYYSCIKLLWRKTLAYVTKKLMFMYSIKILGNAAVQKNTVEYILIWGMYLCNTDNVI